MAASPHHAQAIAALSIGAWSWLAVVDACGDELRTACMSVALDLGAGTMRQIERRKIQTTPTAPRGSGFETSMPLRCIR